MSKKKVGLLRVNVKKKTASTKIVSVKITQGLEGENEAWSQIG